MKQSNKLVISASAIIFYWVVIAAYVLFGAIPTTPIELPFSQNLNTQIIVPQGWSFFTRDPRESTMSLYQKDHENGGKWVKLILPNSDEENLFGIKRTSRSKGVEYGRLLAKTNGTVSWTGYNESIESCFLSVADTLQATEVINDTPAPFVCGEILFVREKLVPWAWRSSNDIEMPKQLLKLHVLCK